MTAGQTFKALLLNKADGKVDAVIRDLEETSLPEGEVVVSVAFSSLNYKDGLAVTGRGPIVRSYPMVPGIDLAGTVERSTSGRFNSGDRVIATGWGLGENHWGGLARKASVMADWLVPLPDEMTLASAMAAGTAGFTAMIAIMELEARGLSPGGRPVLVTGAAGGVGSTAVAILARLGYQVTASTGRKEAHEYLRSIGATDILDRGAVTSGVRGPLDSQRWAGAIDAVGGETLAALLPRMAERSSIAVCGNAGGPDFSASVFPFILRGVSLIGIESVRYPSSLRPEVWRRIARDLPVEVLDTMAATHPLDDVPRLSQSILEGQIRGRIVVDVNA